MKLRDSSILITGGINGIGLELVEQWIGQGAADIIITGRNLPACRPSGINIPGFTFLKVTPVSRKTFSG